MSDTTPPHKEKLMADLRQVIADTETSLRLTTDPIGDSAIEARKHLQTRLRAARTQLSHLQDMAISQAKAAGAAADDLVHAHPWPSIGLAALAGLLAGWLLSRR